MQRGRRHYIRSLAILVPGGEYHGTRQPGVLVISAGEIIPDPFESLFVVVRLNQRGAGARPRDVVEADRYRRDRIRSGGELSGDIVLIF